ncbi:MULTISPECIES: AAA family ATPase [Stutzerimonas stutzeri subgroup]|nr:MULTISPECIES: AAA family ATPase [Stutzerimonas stutzeri subgroup]MCQ2040893.1 AAA family ATPase [Stutzerimonas kunmingensis]
MLNSITLKNVATFDSDGVALDGLSKINFVYGANGSGKTTVSNFLSGEFSERYSSCAASWVNNQPLELLVYNKVFREKNFGKSTIEGIFTLGQSTTEELAVIDQKKAELENIRIDGVNKSETLAKINADIEEVELSFKDKVWISYFKKYESNFKVAFKGFAQKESFKARLLRQAAPVAQIKIEDLEAKAEIVFVDAQPRVEAPSLFTMSASLLDDSIWRKKIIGKQDVDIAKLIGALNLGDWLNQGLKYMHGDTCPFCQQKTITDSFRAKVAEYFDDSFTSSMSELKAAEIDYKSAVDDLAQYLALTEQRLASNLIAKVDINNYKLAVNAFLSLLSANMELVASKLKEPSLSIQLHPIKDEWAAIELLLKKGRDNCLAHNEILDHYDEERSNLISAVWDFIAQQAKKDVAEYRVKLNGLSKGRDNIARIIADKRAEYFGLNADIKALVSQTTSVQPAVDEINAILRGCGFDNFEIIPADSVLNHYQIKRADGSLAEPTLSEGEISFITFLYFLQLVKGGKSVANVSSPRVLVIDDPISSLDSGILFVVSTLIKSLIKAIKSGLGDVRQLIILTHNVYFHKEASFIDGRTKCINDVNYWVLRKGERFSAIVHHGINNPISTSYELLWREYKETPDTSAVTLQNVMRRIIENYFKILGKYGDDDLIAMFDTHEDREVCRSLVAWINDGSHCMPDDLFIQAHGAEVQVYRKVFKKIFQLTNHEGHYEMMTR